MTGKASVRLKRKRACGRNYLIRRFSKQATGSYKYRWSGAYRNSCVTKDGRSSGEGFLRLVHELDGAGFCNVEWVLQLNATFLFFLGEITYMARVWDFMAHYKYRRLCSAATSSDWPEISFRRSPSSSFRSIRLQLKAFISSGGLGDGIRTTDVFSGLTEHKGKNSTSAGPLTVYRPSSHHRVTETHVYW